jgi:D-alanyl-D-alanine carboxypeptidase/D-alanyl-D-alanine-endopeptidase (penicillin-binding protein 4)
MTDRSPDLTRRLLLAGLIAGGAQAALAAPPTVSLRPLPRPGLDSAGARAVRVSGLEDLVAAARLSGKIGCVVADARSGAVLEVMNPVLPLPPASTAKAITALYALDALGAGHRFRTRLIADGPVEAGRLKGDLILAGGGDPTLDTDALGDLAGALKRTGIFEVTGRLLTHDAGWPDVRSIDPGQPDHLGYSPAISGLNLNYNRVHFEWRRGQGGAWALSMEARGQRFRPAVQTARIEIARRAAPVFTYSGQGGVDRWSVAEGALGNGGARWLPVRRPEAYAAETFASLARSHGIVLRPGGAVARLPAGAQVLASQDSLALAEILRAMLRYSTNITAECVGLAASARLEGEAPGSLAASGRGMSGWLEARAKAHQARFVDHSGLGDASRISAGEMVRSLVQLAPDAGLKPLLREVGMRDAKGRPMEGYPATISAKTGTLNFVSTLAGFVDMKNGRELAFTIFCADMERRDALSREERERPEGSRAWIGRARKLQFELIDRWAGLYG